MKRKIVMMLVLALSTGMLLTGCQKETEEKEEPKKVEQTQKKEEKKEELKFIGTEEEGNSKIILENKTGKDIKGISVKKSEETEFAENLLTEGDIYSVDEKRYFCYKFQQEAEATGEDEKLLTQGYDVQLTFTDDTMAVLHGFPWEDMKEGAVWFEEDMAYLMYESVSTKEEQNTKETEAALKAQKEAEEAAAAEAAAAAEKAAQEAAAKEAAEKEAQAAAEQAAKQQQQSQSKPQTQQKPSSPAPKPEPTPQPEPTPEPAPEPDTGGGEGCLDDGLFY